MRWRMDCGISRAWLRRCGTGAITDRRLSGHPFGSVALGHTSLHSSVTGGASGSVSDTYLMLGFGAGFQFSPSVVLRPALTFNLDNDLVDDTVFSFGVSFALPR